jgi:hypothetical protein
MPQNIIELPKMEIKIPRKIGRVPSIPATPKIKVIKPIKNTIIILPYFSSLIYIYYTKMSKMSSKIVIAKSLFLKET